ncbi:uncharacterized protein LOC114411167 [Glycine soja]|uniref:uncharacterized protein n=1 Tax=Glycine max TaxID=3847 RepID=UPI0007193B8B|nr:uncharacterized protein LOC106798820 [Glycine max]XP_028230722.1 uncharacterized protein LOC114411167 [Glycine soja]|eukprot:XP_014631481.1 uncharacterized protein LOC106798820 [Glycine max]
MKRNPRSTKCDPSYWEYVDAFHSTQNSNSSVKRSASSFEQPNPRRIMPMLDQFQPFIHDFIDNIIDVQADGNYGYWSVSGLLGMGEDSWSLVRTHLLIELGKFLEDYIKLFGGTDKFEELRISLHVDGTPDGILNILEATMTPTRQNEFVGYLLTGINPKKFDIPSGCTMDEPKDLIKQIAPHGIPPYGIH